jgi:hypothetical protein
MARVTLVVGQAQQGKTTLALAILQQEAVRGLILDPVRSKPFTNLPGARVFPSWTALCTFLGSREAEGRWTVLLRSLEFEDYTWALRAAPFYRHVMLLVDEGLTFAQDKEAYDPLVKLCRMNAHFGGGLGVPAIITAQRPMDLPADVRSQADRWYSFRQEEPRDLQFLSERCSPDFADQVAGLGPHQYLTFPPTSAATRKGLHDEQAQGRAGVRAGGFGGTRGITHDTATERDPETASPNGRRELVIKGAEENGE